MGGYKSFGCLPFWLDGKTYDTSPYKHPYSDHLTLNHGTCKSKYPASWGAKTKSGSFCKGTGKSGTCGTHGDSYAWCRTRDHCKGTASSHGNWDKCTPATEAIAPLEELDEADEETPAAVVVPTVSEALEQE